LALDGYSECPRDDGVRMRSLNGPEPHFVRQLLVRNAKVLAPLFYVSKLFGWGIRIHPAIRCNAINDVGVPAKNAKEKLDVLSVKTVDVILDQGY